MKLLFISKTTLFSLALQMLLEIKTPLTTVTLVDSLRGAEEQLKQRPFDLGLIQPSPSQFTQLKALAPNLTWLVLSNKPSETPVPKIVYFPLNTSPIALIKFLNELTQQPKLDRKSLTSREKEIMTLVMTGLTHQGIAAQLGISPRTVNSHLQHIYQKINVSSKAQAITVCLQDELLD